MLELAILGLLKEQDLHGYELKKRLGETLGGGSGVSFGSLYPALGRLEAAGAVKAVEATTGAGVWAGLIPGTGSLGGELAAFRARKGATRGSRGKKVYGITPRGELLFDELLAAESSSSDDERVFHLRLAFARYLPRDARLGLLERRRAFLLERLAHTADAIRNGWERLDAYTRSLLEHGHETTERDISWLDRLIAREREVLPDPVRTPSGLPGSAGDEGEGSPRVVAVPSAALLAAVAVAADLPAVPTVAADLPAVPTVAADMASIAVPSAPVHPVPIPSPGASDRTTGTPFARAAPFAPTVPVPPAATQEGSTR